MSAYSAVRAIWRQLPEGMRGAFAQTPALRTVINTMSRRLMSHDDIYGDEYYRSAELLAESSATPIAQSVIRDLAPRTVLDVGCGSGALLAALAARGIDVTGLENSEAALTYCRNRGLCVCKFDLRATRLPPMMSHFDLVVSMEVGEHLPQRIADRFVDLLTRYANTVVFTAATPGQGGTDHVNEQPHEYWIDKFAKRWFEYASEQSLAWRMEWERQGTAPWYSRNLMLFRAKPHRLDAST